MKNIIILFFALCISVLINIFWSQEPDLITAEKTTKQSIAGQASVRSLIYSTRSLLDKNGGYISNDIFPLSQAMDNITAFEFGALEQIRDFALILRREFSRNKSQSTENKNLAQAQPKLSIDHKSFMLPSAEKSYYQAINLLEKYLDDIKHNKAVFAPRAGNLVAWLNLVSSRLGDLSQRLSEQKDSTDQLHNFKKWLTIDNVFYETRGSCWALINLLEGVSVDFKGVLQKKNINNFDEIKKELLQTQNYVWSPMILNGNGFGLTANHLLVMANYVSRANATIIDMINLLEKG